MKDEDSIAGGHEDNATMAGGHEDKDAAHAIDIEQLAAQLTGRGHHKAIRGQDFTRE